MRKFLKTFGAAVLMTGALVLAVNAATDGYQALRQAGDPIMGLYKSSPSTLADGDYDVVRLTTAGLLRVSVDANTVSGASSSKVQGTAASAAAKTGNPVMIGGQDGTNAETLLTDTSGRPMVVGAAASGAAKAGNPMLIAGQDGTNAVTLLTSSGGSPLIAGDTASAVADAGNPLKVGGIATTLPFTAVSESNRVNASFDLQGSLRVIPAIPASFWSITNAAAVNNVATATQGAAASGVKHVCTGFQASLWQDSTGTVSTASGFTVAIRDGASGAGTVKWSKTFSFPVATNGVGAEVNVVFPTPIVGTAATAMCVEFTSSALLHTGCTVNAQGFDTK